MRGICKVSEGKGGEDVSRRVEGKGWERRNMRK